jgi:hypothetical protein
MRVVWRVRGIDLPNAAFLVRTQLVARGGLDTTKFQ